MHKTSDSTPPDPSDTTPPPPIYDGDDEWFIARKSWVTTFDDSSRPEIVVQYLVPKAINPNQVDVHVYDYACDEDAKHVSFDPPHYVSGSVPNSGLGILQLEIDINEKLLYTSNIWEYTNTAEKEGAIKFCVQVDLMDRTTGYSIAMVRTKAEQELRIEGDFELEPIGAVEVVDEKTDDDAKVDYTVTACICDKKNDYSCIDKPLPATVNSGLKMCIFAESDEVEVFKVTEFRMKQQLDVGSFTYEPVKKSVKNTLTSVEILEDANDAMFAYFTTPLITPFFDQYDPEVIKAEGEVLLTLIPNRRKLHLFRARNTEEKETIVGNFETVIELDDGSAALALVVCGAATLLSALLSI
jgi:hypothetical protein